MFESILKYLIYPEHYTEEYVNDLCNKISTFWINLNELKELISKTEDSEKENVEKAYKMEILQRVKRILTSFNYLNMYERWKVAYCIDD